MGRFGDEACARSVPLNKDQFLVKSCQIALTTNKHNESDQCDMFIKHNTRGV